MNALNTAGRFVMGIRDSQGVTYRKAGRLEQDGLGEFARAFTRQLGTAGRSPAVLLICLPGGKQ